MITSLHSFDWTFTSLGAAQMFFNSNPLDLGAYGIGNQYVDIYYTMDPQHFGDGFGFNYNLAELPLVTPPAVPETSTWVMMLTGFAGLGFAAFRRSQRAKATFAA